MTAASSASSPFDVNGYHVLLGEVHTDWLAARHDPLAVRGRMKLAQQLALAASCSGESRSSSVAARTEKNIEYIS